MLSGMTCTAIGGMCLYLKPDRREPLGSTCTRKGGGMIPAITGKAVCCGMIWCEAPKDGNMINRWFLCRRVKIKAIKASKRDQKDVSKSLITRGKTVRRKSLSKLKACCTKEAPKKTRMRQQEALAYTGICMLNCK